MYVSWLVQGSALMTGVLSAMPAWQFFDPMPIIRDGGYQRKEKRMDESDNEQVETMFDETS